MGKGTGTVEVQWYKGRPPAAVREQRTARWHQRSWNASTERRGSRPRYQALYMPPARRSPPPTRSQSRLQAARIWANDPSGDAPSRLLGGRMGMPRAVSREEAGQHGEAQALPQQLEAGVRCPSPAVVSEEQVDAVWRAGLACHRRPGSTHPGHHGDCQRTGDEDVAECRRRPLAAGMGAQVCCARTNPDVAQEGAHPQPPVQNAPRQDSLGPPGGRPGRGPGRSPTTRQARLQGTSGAGWRAARSWLSLGGGSGGGGGGTGAAAAPDASRTRLGGGRDGAGCIQGASVDGSGAARMRVAPDEGLAPPAAADPP